MDDYLPAAHRNDPLLVAPEEDLPDVVLVNPGGRVIEVTGAMAQDLLMQMGYRRASEQEAASYEDMKKRNHPELLKRAEMRRVREERARLDALEREIAAEDTKVETPPTEPEDIGPDEEAPKPRSRK